MVGKYEDLRGDEYTLPAVTGRAWVFGDFVRSQQILADEYLGSPPHVAKSRVLATVAPRFAHEAQPGDVIVAGVDFAGDATRRSIPAAIRALGVTAVIARSFGRRFLDDAIQLGLPALIVEETAAIKTGDRLRVDVEAHIVANLSSGDRYVIRNMEEDALAILRGASPTRPTDPRSTC
jgi:3-isopropylmalate/(R)-2-methylmalate dehydratase small subunit